MGFGGAAQSGMRALYRRTFGTQPVQHGGRVSIRPTRLRAACATLLLLVLPCRLGFAPPLDVPRGSRKTEPFVDIARACPGVLIDLRYATEKNVVGQPLYPPRARALIRESVAARLQNAQTLLKPFGARLKVWDAYRPHGAHLVLWELIRDREHVSAPELGGSLHTWGVAVDLTLTDLHGRELRMPTGFDDFSPAAKSVYRGPDKSIAANLKLLQHAMGSSGFMGLHDEWWHFVAVDYRAFAPADVSLTEPPRAVVPLAPGERNRGGREENTRR